MLSIQSIPNCPLNNSSRRTDTAVVTATIPEDFAVLAGVPEIAADSTTSREVSATEIASSCSIIEDCKVFERCPDFERELPSSESSLVTTPLVDEFPPTTMPLADDSQAAVKLLSENKILTIYLMQTAETLLADESQLATTQLADESQLATTLVADESQLATTLLADESQWVAIPLADDTKPATTPLTDESQSVVTPLADESQSSATTLADDFESDPAPSINVSPSVTTHIASNLPPVVIEHRIKQDISFVPDQSVQVEKDRCSKSNALEKRLSTSTDEMKSDEHVTKCCDVQLTSEWKQSTSRRWTSECSLTALSKDVGAVNKPSATHTKSNDGNTANDGASIASHSSNRKITNM